MTVFIDPEFPPISSSLFSVDPLAEIKGESATPTDSGTLPAIEWRRPRDFLAPDKPLEIFEGGIEPADIAQGQLGDCWLMCSLASLAEFDNPIGSPIRDIITESDHELGIYKVKLCKAGVWKEYILDSFFPCFPGGEPIYSKAHGHELWVMLLEKAFAKANGSYTAIRSGWAYEALVDCTGAPYKDFRLGDWPVQKVDELWKKIRKYDQSDYCMTLSTPGVDHSTESGSFSTIV